MTFDYYSQATSLNVFTDNHIPVFTFNAGLLPSLSHHSFTHFAASNASKASLEQMENEESSMTSTRPFNTTEEDGQLVEVRWSEN